MQIRVVTEFSWILRWKKNILINDASCEVEAKRSAGSHFGTLIDRQPSFTEFIQIYRVFTEFYWVLLGFTEFYWVLPSFTGFYRVLLSAGGRVERVRLKMNSDGVFYWH